MGRCKEGPPPPKKKKSKDNGHHVAPTGTTTQPPSFLIPQGGGAADFVAHLREADGADHDDTPLEKETVVTSRTKGKHGKSKSTAHDVGPTRRNLAKMKKVADENDGEQEDLDEDARIMEEFGARGYYEKVERGTLGKRHLERYLQTISDESVDSVEVDWIMMIADKDESGSITMDELKDVRVALNTYKEARKHVGRLIKKYDRDCNGLIEREELRGLLADLNDGIPIHSTELDWVMENANKFDRGHLVQPELEQAIIFWYSHADAPTQQKVLDHAKGGAVGRALTALLENRAPSSEEPVKPAKVPAKGHK